MNKVITAFIVCISIIVWYVLSENDAPVSRGMTTQEAMAGVNKCQDKILAIHAKLEKDGLIVSKSFTTYSGDPFKTLEHCLQQLNGMEVMAKEREQYKLAK